MELAELEQILDVATQYNISFLRFKGFEVGFHPKQQRVVELPEGTKGPEEKLPTEEDFLYHSTGIKFEPVNPVIPEKA